MRFLVQRGQEAKSQKHRQRAKRLLTRALDLDGSNIVAAAVLCSVLRDCEDPQAALAVTEPFLRHADPVLLTTRAAALCDLRRWDEAKRAVGRALAIIGSRSVSAAASREAQAVVNTIRQARPDLYPR